MNESNFIKNLKYNYEELDIMSFLSMVGIIMVIVITLFVDSCDTRNMNGFNLEKSLSYYEFTPETKEVFKGHYDKIIEKEKDSVLANSSESFNAYTYAISMTDVKRKAVVKSNSFKSTPFLIISSVLLTLGSIPFIITCMNSITLLL